MKAETVPVYKI